MQSPVDQIKERLSISDVVGSYVKLEKAGVNLKARCPFHNEKTASFFVSPTRGTYHCFGCNKGGDIFSFVQDIEGVEFVDALKQLADRAGVVLKHADPRAKREFDNLYSLMEESVSYYEEELGKNNEALLYLKSRGLSEKTIKDFHLGFAGSSWTGALNHLKKKGFSENDMEKTGFLVKTPRGYHDRFRDRIMFPLWNSSGKVAGFSGRIFLPREKEKEAELAKYLNTPDTVLYNKSRLLYGYDKAKNAMLRESSCVLVEGQMDLIMSHQAGVSNSVAISGTALTDDHLKMIRRFCDTLVLALDTDKAGISASERAFAMAITLGFDVRVAEVPGSKDPADFIKVNGEKWPEVVKNTKHIIDYLLDRIKEKKLEERAYRLEVSKKVLPYVGRIENRIDQAHFVSRVAKDLRTDEEHVWEEVRKIARSPEGKVSSAISGNEKSPIRKDMIMGNIIGIISWQEGEKEKLIDLKKAMERFDTLAKTYQFPEFKQIPKEEEKKAGFQAELYYGGHKHIPKELEELFLNLEMVFLEDIFSRATANLKLAEGSGGDMDSILKECQEISKKINDIKSKITKS